MTHDIVARYTELCHHAYISPDTAREIVALEKEIGEMIKRLHGQHAAYTVMWLAALTDNDVRAELAAYYAARRAAKCERYKIARACASGWLKPESAMKMLNETIWPKDGAA